jgi:succinate dehydrogenase/fumarate reductase cytochrome b subunit
LAPIRPVTAIAPMNDSLKTLLIVAFLGVILWNLGAGLYYMLVDKGATKRTVNALTKRIALSVVLILLVALSIYMGWITPHGVGR